VLVDGLQHRWPREDLAYLRLLGSTLLVLLLVPLVVIHLLFDPVDAGDRMLNHAIR